ncbi:MAG TPA: SPFH domain-containing protein [Cytophagaceae bacterium]|jgi:membrane protease subunit (stomatin/prohibitin family)|nr:SPFH domain-containing protein [Cytophagaceae bacterium]
MGLFDKLKGEFIDVIEWLDNTQDTMIYRFERYNNEIKNGAQLTVRPGQVAVFVNEGNQVADIYTSGRYELNTQNMPVMTLLNSWKFGFNSPFKAEVYFFNMKEFIDMKWGVKEPILYTDPRFGIDIEAKAFGTYGFKFKDPKIFMEKFSSTNGVYTTENISGQLRSILVMEFSDKLNEAGIPANKLAGNLKELSSTLHPMINESVEAKYGLSIPTFLIESISLTDEDKRRIKMISEKMALGDSSTFVQQDLLDTMKISAKQGGSNPAVDMMGMMMGMNMMNQNNMMNQQNNQQNKMNVPPPPPVESYFVAVNGQQAGPYTVNQLAQFASQGQFNAQTLVWKQGMAAWTAAGQLPELAAVFNSTPPPPPPPPAG